MAWKERCLDYVTGRQSRDGGFCFYGSDYIEESNLYDTGFALATLLLLQGEPLRKKALESWLAAQGDTLDESGSLSALWSYARSMRLLGLAPPEKIDSAIERSLAAFRLPSPGELPNWDAGALFRDLLRLAELSTWRSSPLPAPFRRKLSELWEALRGQSGSLPRACGNLVGGWHALALARSLRLPIEERPLLDLARERLTRADPCGFRSTEAQTLQAICCGLAILAAFSQPPEAQRKDSLASQIEACQAASGGFGRRIGAIPTLEDSYYGAQALAFLQ